MYNTQMTIHTLAKLPSQREVRDALERGVTLVTATQRLARQLLKDVAPSDGGVMRMPRVTSLDSWLNLEFQLAEESRPLPRRLLTPPEIQLLWQDVIEGAQREDNDFSLIQPAAAAELASRCRRALRNHEVPMSSQTVRVAFNAEPDTRRFLQWLDRLNASLLKQNWAMPEDCYSIISAFEAPKKSELWFLSEEEPPAALERAFLSKFTKVIWMHSNPTDEPYKTLVYDTPEDEIAAAATWAKHQHEQGKSAVVVLVDYQRDRALLEHYLRRAFEVSAETFTNLPVNFSRGIELSKTPMYRDAVLFLRLLSQPLNRAEITALLRSPFFQWGDYGLSLRVKTLRRVYKTARGEFSVDAVLSILLETAPSTAFTETLSISRRTRVATQNFSYWTWRDHILEMLASAGWPSASGLDSLEYQQYELLASISDALEVGTEDSKPVSLKKAVQLFSAALNSRIFQPKTETTNLQVMFLRDTFGLSFDAARVVGASSESFPPNASQLNFIPWQIARSFDINGVFQSTSETITSRLLAGLGGSDELILSFHKVADAAAKFPSKFSADVQSIMSARSTDSLPEELPGELISDPQGLILSEPTKQKGGVGLLEDQSGCPMKAHLKHRIGLEPLAAVSLGLSASERGKIMHWGLENLFSTLPNSEAIQNTEPHSVAVAAKKAAKAAVAKVSADVRDRVGLEGLALEKTRLSALLIRWVELERGREIPFNIEATETSFEWICGHVTLSFKADRVDVLESGKRLVIDYKSANAVRFSDWTQSPLASPQLPSYTQVIANVGAISIASIAGDSPGYFTLGEQIGISASDNKGRKVLDELGHADLQPLKDTWKNELVGLISNFVEGMAAPTPSDKSCRYCDFDAICRVKIEEGFASLEDQQGE